MNIINVQDKLDKEITLYPMQKIEIIVDAVHEKTIATMIEKANIMGFTIIREVSGKGHSGFHESNLLFNNKNKLVMFIAVAKSEEIVTIAKAMKQIFQKNRGVMFVSEVKVARARYFE